MGTNPFWKISCALIFEWVNMRVAAFAFSLLTYRISCALENTTVILRTPRILCRGLLVRDKAETELIFAGRWDLKIMPFSNMSVLFEMVRLLF